MIKFIAFDDEDLQVVSAHAQDAVIKVSDMKYVPGQNLFVALMNRFVWEKAPDRDKNNPHQRRRAALRIDRVLGVKSSGINLSSPEGVLALLSMTFEPDHAPSGTLRLDFAGGGALAIDVECLEAQLEDLGAAWGTKAKPDHIFDEDKG